MFLWINLPELHIDSPNQDEISSASVQVAGAKNNPIILDGKSTAFSVAYIFEGRKAYLASGLVGDLFEIGGTKYQKKKTTDEEGRTTTTEVQQQMVGDSIVYVMIPKFQLFLSGFIGFKEDDEESRGNSAFGMGPRLSINNNSLSIFAGYHFRLQDDSLIGRPMVAIGFKF